MQPTPLSGGGVSGELTFVDGPDGPTVIKRALPKLKVAADWFASPERSAVEAACLRVLAEVLGQECVPRVLWVDERAHTFGMQRLPDHLVVWKARLLGCDDNIALPTTTARDELAAGAVAFGRLRGRGRSESGDPLRRAVRTSAPPQRR